MQNKGLIKFLAWAFAAVCLFQLSFTIVTNVIQSKAKTDAKNYVNSEQAQKLIASRSSNQLEAQIVTDSIMTAREAHYLDSMATEKVYLGYTYRECQGREINLGLDLKGGMNVMLEVSTVDVVRALATTNAEDPTFVKAVENALAKQKVTTNRDFVSLFYEEITALDPNVSLAAIFGSGDLREKIKMGDDNENVINAVREEASEAYDRTYQIISKRIDKFGVAQPTIQKLSASERILVELPGVKEPERVRKLLKGTAQLEFWQTYDNTEAIRFLEAADKYLASVHGGEKVAEEDSVAQVEADSSSLVDQLAVDNATTQSGNSQEMAKTNPLFALLMPYVNQNNQPVPGPIVGLAHDKDRAAIDAMLAQAAARKVFDTRSVKFLWSNKADDHFTGGDIFTLYAIKITTRDGAALLDGSCISDARQDFSTNGKSEVSMTMNSAGAREWKRITGENVGKCIAIVLDDLVYSAPTVNGEIAGGRSSITGDFTLDEAKDLANILKSGKLPAPANIVSEAVVGPSLGQESIRNGLWSFILAFIIVLIYMVIFYNRAGWVSVIALIINVFLLIGVLASIGAVLTLPGIAGIVLTMAMAVDGNVIIYERVKEELRAGSSLSTAVENGFKNAYSAIIDGQVTTFLLGIVLIMFGSGAVQGFAVTLCIGIVTSLFTSIFITRLFIDSSLSHKRKMNFSFSFSENFLRDVHIDFLGKRKMFYAIAGVAIVVCFAFLFTKGLDRGIDFSGGRSYVVRFDQSVNENEVRSMLADQFDNDAPEVKSYGPSNQVKITTGYKIDEDGDEVKNEIVAKLFAGSQKFFKNPITVEEFASTETNPYGIIQSDQFGAGVAHDNLVHSIWAVLGGLLVMFVYIGLRFRSWRFGVGSVTALAHDTILVIGVFSILGGLLPFNLELDQYFISAVLTVIGYSINATVVIFDRVREYRKLYPKRDLMTHMNDAINSTLARTVNTSGTTFVTLLMMFIFGGEVIRGFIFALLVGVLVGVFSSLCIASAVVYEISGKEKTKALAEK
jgi:SecD/SecF fusion protein